MARGSKRRSTTDGNKDSKIGKSQNHTSTSRKALAKKTRSKIRVQDINLNDVLHGRGTPYTSHNKKTPWRSIVDLTKPVYQNLTDNVIKRQLALEIVARGGKKLDPPGRFLEQDNGKKYWYEVDEKAAVHKTMTALRSRCTVELEEPDVNSTNKVMQDINIGLFKMSIEEQHKFLKPYITIATESNMIHKVKPPMPSLKATPKSPSHPPIQPSPSLPHLHPNIAGPGGAFMANQLIAQFPSNLAHPHAAIFAYNSNPTGGRSRNIPSRFDLRPLSRSGVGVPPKLGREESGDISLFGGENANTCGDATILDLREEMAALKSQNEVLRNFVDAANHQNTANVNQLAAMQMQLRAHVCQTGEIASLKEKLDDMHRQDELKTIRISKLYQDLAARGVSASSSSKAAV